MILNLQNVEQLVFFDEKAYKLLPEFRVYFEQWRISKRVPGMQNLGKSVIMSFLLDLKSPQLEKLEEYFKDTIVVDAIDYRTVQNYVGTIDEVQDALCEFEAFTDLAIYRKEDQIKVTFWK